MNSPSLKAKILRFGNDPAEHHSPKLSTMPFAEAATNTTPRNDTIRELQAQVEYWHTKALTAEALRFTPRIASHRTPGGTARGRHSMGGVDLETPRYCGIVCCLFNCIIPLFITLHHPTATHSTRPMSSMHTVPTSSAIPFSPPIQHPQAPAQNPPPRHTMTTTTHCLGRVPGHIRPC